MSATSGTPVQWGTPEDHAACGDAIAAARALGARDALLSLAAALDRKGAEQHAEARATQRLGMEAVSRTITAMGRTYEVTAAIARRRAESGPVPENEAAPVSGEGQERSGKSEAVQAAGDAVAAMFPGLGPQTGRKVAAAVLDAARPHLTRAAFYMEGVKAERQRIRELADRNGAVCTGAEGTSCYFSALIGEVPNG